MATKVIAGKELELDADGHLKNRVDWNEVVARELAKEEGIPELTDRHWAVINYMKRSSRRKGMRRPFAN